MAIPYIVPQLQIFQTFAQSVVAQPAPRAAAIVGPQAALFRYAVPDEKLLNILGAYDFENDTTYAWPNRPVGSRIDLPYVKLFVDDAKLKYYERDAGASGTATVPSGQTNRVRTTNAAFKSNGASYPASAAVGDREAQVGDLAQVSGTVSAVDYSVDTRIIGFVADIVAGTVGTATGETSNATTQGAALSIDLVGPENAVTINGDGSLYDGRGDGAIDETYLLEVTRGSTDSDFTTARFKITSSSGLDSHVNITPAAAGTPFLLGSRGLKITLGLVSGPSASSQTPVGDAITDLFIGQAWRIHVKQAFTAPTPTATGAYTARSNTIYIVDVILGGAFGTAKFSVTTNNGVDSSGPTLVATAATDYAVGTGGTTIRFSGASGLRAGDRYYIPVTGVTDGYLRTLVLADDVPVGLRPATDLTVKLYIKDDIEVPQISAVDINAENYVAIDGDITVNEAIEVYVPQYTVGGDPAPLPLEGGTLYVEYRAWLGTDANKLATLYDPAAVVTALGTVHPDNPLAYAVFLAASNSNGASVAYVPVANPDDDDSWLLALEKFVGRTNVYTLVPLTTDDTIRVAALGQATAESGSTKRRWRRAAVGIDASPLKALVNAATTTDLGEALATLADDPGTSGTQYTLLSVPAGNAKFLTNGVRAGDQVRYLFTIDTNGATVYRTFTVDQVISETTLKLLEPYTGAITVAQKVEVWRTLVGTELATEIASRVSDLGRNRRLIVIANPTVVATDGEVPGYFAAAAYAGYRSGVPAHQPLTRSTLTGIIGAGTLVDSLNSDQLDVIAGSGGFILVRDDVTQSLYIRDAITTDNDSEGEEDEMFGSNFDDVSYQLAQTLEALIGRVNVTDNTLLTIRARLDATARTIQGNDVANIGAQILTYTIVSVAKDATFRNRVNAKMQLTLPYTLKVIILELEAE